MANKTNLNKVVQSYLEAIKYELFFKQFHRKEFIAVSGRFQNNWLASRVDYEHCILGSKYDGGEGGDIMDPF